MLIDFVQILCVCMMCHKHGYINIVCCLVRSCRIIILYEKHNFHFPLLVCCSTTVCSADCRHARWEVKERQLSDKIRTLLFVAVHCHRTISTELFVLYTPLACSMYVCVCVCVCVCARARARARPPSDCPAPVIINTTVYWFLLI